MHSSGNPVPWDVENGAEHKEYLSMLHVKKGDYAHWAIRINRASRRITHISAGPIIKARDYRNEVRPPAECHLLKRGLADGDILDPLCMLQCFIIIARFSCQEARCVLQTSCS